MAICVTQFDPSQLERGLICSEGALPTIMAAIVEVHRIPYFKQTVTTKAKFHITLGHETVMGKATFFCKPPCCPEGVTGAAMTTNENSSFSYDTEYLYQEELLSKQSAATSDGKCVQSSQYYAVLELEHPVTCPADSIIIGSRLDADIHTTSCRLAFHGRILHAIKDTKQMDAILPTVKVYKVKYREGVIERMMDEYNCVCKGLFKKESNLEAFVGLKVQLSSGEKGVIEGSFGQSGKFKIGIPG